jgi:7-cyano-7-deazaguanine synthase in queuosine biosynthesis
MGKSGVIFVDGSVYDVDKHFPLLPAKVALSMSGGVESTLLLAILVQRYGPENVKVFSGKFDGRRHWESTHPQYIAGLMGVKQTYAIPIANYHMSPKDNWNMFIQAKHTYDFDYWFNGTNAKLFSSRNVTKPEEVDKIKQQGYMVPFVWLEKWQTIELYGLLGFNDLLIKSHSCTINPPEHNHCGECPCCMERIYGFHQLGKFDPTTYNIPYAQALRNTVNFIEETK